MLRRSLALFLVLSQPVLAQEEATTPSAEPSRRIIYQDVTLMELDGAELNAPVQGPEIHMLPARVSARFNPMIRLRVTFNDSMEDSVDEVR